MAELTAGISLRDGADVARLIADHSSVLIWSAGPDGHYVWFNHGWLTFVGKSMHEELDDGWMRSVHAADVDRYLQAYEACFDARIGFAVEYRHRRHDGAYRWLLNQGAPVYEAGGRFAGYIGVCIDITERKAAEEQLAFRAEELRNVFDAVPALVWIANDPDCRRIVANRTARDYPADDVPLRTVTESTKAQSGVDVDFAMPNGGVTHAVGNVAPLFNARGDVRGAIAVFMDVASRELSWMRRLHDLSTQLGRLETLEDLLAEILRAVREITAADMGNVQLVDERGELRICAQDGFEREFLEFFEAVSRSDASSCGVALERHERVLVEDVEQDPIIAGTQSLEILRRAGVRAMQSTPIFNRSGGLIAMLNTHYRQPRRFNHHELRVIDVIVRQTSDVIESFRTTQALQATNDALRKANEGLEQALEREREVAQTLQAALLPTFLPRVQGVTFDACYRPALRESQVGGDWYDAFILPDGRIALSIGDIVGHGFEAAGEMVRLRETLRAIAGLIDDDPATIMKFANRAFRTSHPNALASAIFAIYEPTTGRLTAANAGHPAPVYVSGEKAKLLPYGGPLLGISADTVFTTSEITLREGDCFVLYTDGLIEVDRDAVAGEQALLKNLSHGTPSSATLVNKLAGGVQCDDIAVLMLSVNSPSAQPSWSFQADDASNAAHARGAFTAYLSQRNVDEESLESAVSVFGELVSNVVRHAPGPIEVELRWDDSPMLYVRDRGPAFSGRNRALPEDLLAESGRGLFLIHAYASAPVVKRRFDGGNEVCVRLPTKSLQPRS